MTVNVVITGLGLATPAGNDTEAYWHRLMTGPTAIGQVTLFDTSAFACHVGGVVSDLGRGGLFADSPCRATRLAAAATGAAIANSRLDLDSIDRDRFGIVLGTSQGLLPGEADGWDERPQWAFHGTVDDIAGSLDARGPRCAVATACTAGAHAIALARDFLLGRRADVMIAGGADSLSVYTWSGFSALRALDPSPCSPFSRSGGLNLGEGAAVVVLERETNARERGAIPLAAIVGFGASADAYSPTAPEPSGRFAALAMQRALADARVRPDEVDYVNAHGTGTPPNDEMERNAMRRVFGMGVGRVPTSGTKSLIGHTLGAAGAVEAATCVLAIVKQCVPPTLNFDGPDDAFFDFVPHRGRRAPVGLAMSNNFAFGGLNSSLLLARPGWDPGPQLHRNRVAVTGIGAVGVPSDGDPVCGRGVAGLSSGVHPGGEGQPLTPPNVWRRMDGFSRACLEACRRAIDDASLTFASGERVAIVLGSACGPSKTIDRFNRSLFGGGVLNPAEFANTAPASPLGHLCTALRAHGPSLAVSAGGVSGGLAVALAMDLVGRGDADAAVAIGADEIGRRAVVAIMLERLADTGARRVRPYCAIAGWAAGGSFVPHGDGGIAGESFAGVMRQALDDAGTAASEIGFCVTAGADEAAVGCVEDESILRVLGPRVRRLSAPSVASGLGASSAVNVAFAALRLRAIGDDGPSPCVVNSWSLGGQCLSMVLNTLPRGARP